jgi:hypothetical protein
MGIVILVDVLLVKAVGVIVKKQIVGAVVAVVAAMARSLWENVCR